MVKTLVHLEHLAIFAGVVYTYHLLQRPWLLFFVLFLLPDISIAAYRINTQIGATCYNLLHNYFLPIVLIFVAFYLSNHNQNLYRESELLFQVVLVWVAHVAFDRVFGFGLKYANGFKPTHLQKI